MNALPRRTVTVRISLFTLFALVLLATGGCQLFEDQPPESAEAVGSDAVASAEEMLAAQREAADAARADAARAEAELQEAEAELERQRADQQAREEQLQKERALAQERARLAEERAAAEERQRKLAERELEIAQREAELAAAPVVEPEPEPAYEPAAEVAAGGGFVSEPEPSPEPDYVQATLRPGTVLQIEILKTLSSASHRAGDRFVSRVARDIYTENGVLAVPAGSEVHGTVIEATPLKRVGGQASLAVEFNELVTPLGERIGLRASFTELGEDQRKDKRKIIGAAVAGAILGRVLGGKGAGEVLAGAAVGAAAGTAVVARNEGREAVIPAGEVVGLVLEEVVTVTTEVTGIAE